MQEEVYLDSLLVNVQSVAECGLKGGKRCHRGNVEGILAVEGVVLRLYNDGGQGGRAGPGTVIRVPVARPTAIKLIDGRKMTLTGTIVYLLCTYYGQS